VFHVKHEGWSEVGAVLGLGLDVEQTGRLTQYEHLLRERAVTLGMISARDASRLRDRHVIDSLRAALAVRPDDRAGCDLGSGAGLPGIVVAIACPWIEVTLAEPRQRRAAFLELAVSELRLGNARVHAGRAQEIRAVFDVCFARALSDAGHAWGLAEPILAPDGRLVYFAGADQVPEVPAGVGAEFVATSLAPSGPLVIMTRQ
jgi:16S rRNA (guanine527-N7)-methyltransferase